MGHVSGPDGHAHAAASAPQGAGRTAQRRALRIALVANGAFMGVEIAGGLIFGSLALLADATHMFSDVVALTIALVAHHLMQRPASPRHTFGLQRAEVLGAQANAVVLLAAAGWIFFEGFRRIDAPHDVDGTGLLVVAGLGLVVNLASARILHAAGAGSLNVRAALVHMLVDAAGSVAAIVAGVVVVTTGSEAADPVMSLAIGALVVVSAAALLREAAHVLMEGTPRHLDLEEVAAAVRSVPGVEALHHLHVWTIASDVPALSAHLVVEGDVTLHEGQRRADAVKGLLEERFGIEHATLEIECHECPDPGSHVTGPASGATPAR